MMKSTLSILAICAASSAVANCDSVTFSDVGWTDITATTAATTVVLDALGYDTSIKVLSVPVTYTALAEGVVVVQPVGAKGAPERTTTPHLGQRGELRPEKRIHEPGQVR